MWTNLISKGRDPRWVVDAIRNGTAVWVTNRSFKSEVSPHVSGAGWLIYYTYAKK